MAAPAVPFRWPQPRRPIHGQARGVETFVEFFRERGHQFVTGSPLVPPPGDPVLFTNLRDAPVDPVSGGPCPPRGQRLVNLQRCLRTTDLDEVATTLT